jgi:hypothetical protein
MLAKESPKKRLDPRVNARRVNEVGEKERQSTGRRLLGVGQRLMKGLYAVALLGLFVAGCAGLFVVIRELGPLTKEGPQPRDST